MDRTAIAPTQGREPMATKTRSVDAAVGALVKVIVDTVRECEGFGIPAGHLYAALSGYVSLATFDDLVNLAVASGKIRRDGDILRVRK